MKNVVQTFCKIIKISSPSGSEENMSKYIQIWLKKNNFSYKVDKLNQIYATNSKDPKLLLTAHLDTVQPGQNIQPKITEDGYIKSDETTVLGADNKAWIAALLCAIVQYKAIFREIPPIELVFTSMEETGGGAENFDFSLIKLKEGITFDSSEPIGSIVITAPYIYNFSAVFKGKAAHASKPEKGINSLIPACRFVSEVKQGKMDNGHTTINIGLMSSGTGINTVPENAIVEGEVRSTEKKLFKKHLIGIEKAAKNIATNFGVKVTFSTKGYCPGYEYDPNDPFIKKVVSVFNSMDFKTKYLTSTGVSDANTFAGEGIKLINYTDAGEFAHTTKERISIKNLELLQKTAFNLLALNRQARKV
jgi:tripeptide aminopeptidase